MGRFKVKYRPSPGIGLANQGSSGFWVVGFGVRVLGLGFWVLGFRVEGVGFWV